MLIINAVAVQPTTLFTVHVGDVAWLLQLHPHQPILNGTWQFMLYLPKNSLKGPLPKLGYKFLLFSSPRWLHKHYVISVRGRNKCSEPFTKNILSPLNKHFKHVFFSDFLLHSYMLVLLLYRSHGEEKTADCGGSVLTAVLWLICMSRT